MTEPTELSQLRHLYQNMVNGAVRDTASAKRIAEGLLAPAIAALERTTPQPTQAQAGAMPLTDEQADAIALESFERHCGRPHPWEGAQPWVIAAIKAAHGIKGGQHGTQ